MSLPPDSVAASSIGPDKAREHAYLSSLGLQVRQRREQAGLTRKRLSALAGVSERYLAQLELGNGNASMLLLRKLARALKCSLTELVDDSLLRQGMMAPGVRRVFDLLASLEPAQLAQAAELLHNRFGSGCPGRRTRVALIGLRGAGKSTVGRQLADQLKVPFFELDHEIEREMGSDLAGIFSVYGQDAYRDAEARVLGRLLSTDEAFVLATGGSIVNAPDAYAQVRQQCFTVWLQADPRDHMARVVEQGDMRPMRGRDHAMAELRHILNSRQHLYQLADLTINTSTRNSDDCVDAIASTLVAGTAPGAVAAD